MSRTGEYSDVKTVSFGPGGGQFGAGANGCGECYQMFTHVLVCLRQYTLHYNKEKWTFNDWGWPTKLIIPCARAVPGESRCTEEIDSVEKCDRPCD